MRKNLFILLRTYPFDFGEPYLEDELKVLEKTFEKIYFVHPESQFIVNYSKKNFYTPPNSQIIPIEINYGFIQKLKSIFGIFHKEFYTELKTIKLNYKLPITAMKLKIVLSFFQKGKDFKHKMLEIIKNENLAINETVLYSYWTNEFTVGLALIKKQFSEIGCYTRMHGGDLYFHRNTEHYLPWRPFIIHQLNAVISISANGKKYLVEKTGNQIAEKKVLVSHLGTHDEAFIDSADVTDCFNILTLSFLLPVKQLERLIDALATIKIIQIKWTHIGGGRNEYEDTLKNYAKYILDKSENVKFEFLASIPKSEVCNEIRKRNIHLLVNTSKYEGIPVSMMEALSMGIPILGVDVGAVNEIIFEGLSGTLLPENADTEMLAKAILYYGKLSVTEFRLVKNKALHFWKENYQASKNYAKFTAILIQDI